MSGIERGDHSGADRPKGGVGAIGREASMFGGVEAGGTKFVCVIGTGPDDILETQRIEVTSPTDTLGAALGFFRRAVESGNWLDAIGIGSFGPVELRQDQARYGRITTTPKGGWSGTDIVGPFAAAFGIPVGYDTDVNAAALAEGRWGAARGLDSFVYLTLGTGVGGGAVIHGKPLHGLLHPEMGHIAVPRRRGDRFEGLCPFHGDCLEGMASGPAIGARFGRRAELLEGADRESAVKLAGFYLAAGVRSIVYALAPERIVVGGGLSEMPGVVAAARAELRGQLRGYPGLPEHDDEDFLVLAYLRSMAGPAGTLILAEQALELAGNTAVAHAAS
jgi:fructokinase